MDSPRCPTGRGRCRPLSTLLACLALEAAWLLAAEPAGRITGRVLNGATGELVRAAEVGVRGRTEFTTTDDTGSFTLAGVAPGAVTVEVAYTGYRTATATLTVPPGPTPLRPPPPRS